jgi:hypothetical protein
MNSGMVMDVQRGGVVAAHAIDRMAGDAGLGDEERPAACEIHIRHAEARQVGYGRERRRRGALRLIVPGIALRMRLRGKARGEAENQDDGKDC